MFVCGSNDFNQLYSMKYRPDEDGNIAIPTKSKIDSNNIISFSTYYHHSVWIDSKNDAYGIGDNRECQFDPSSKKKVYSAPKKIDFLQRMFKNETFCSAVCGESYTLYLSTFEDDEGDGLHYVTHFVDKNFSMNKNSHKFDEEVFIYGGNDYAAVITYSGNLYIYSDLKTYEPNNPFDIKIRDIALCKYFAIAVTEDLDAISIPIGVNSKMIKFKSLKMFNIHTISGTYEQAVAVASEKEDSSKHSILLFQYNPTRNRPQVNPIPLDKFYDNSINISLVSCADCYTLLLGDNGLVYYTQDFKEYKIVKVPKTKFIIAGRDTQVYVTTKVSIQMPNYHYSEFYENEEEEEYIEFKSRSDVLAAEKLEEQKKNTSLEIDALSKEIFKLQNPKIFAEKYKKICTIGNPTFHSEVIKVLLNGNEDENDKKLYALKLLKNIRITDYCNLVSKIEKFNNDFYHPLIVKESAYNYNIENLETEKNQKLHQIRANEDSKEEKGKQIEIPELDDDTNISYHNFDIKIQNDIDKYQSDFYYPFIMMPLFSQNLFDFIESGSISNTDKMFIITEILMTVSYLHDSGIYHQRLTPWNIFISNSNNAFISDIFNSEFIENEQMIILKDENALWFIDPEIINSDTLDYEQNNDIIMKNHDVYSIGKLIFYILSGMIGKPGKEKINFANRTCLQCMLNEEVDFQDDEISFVEPIDFPSDFGDDLKKLISNCISFSKEGRPSVRSILDGIKSVNYQLIPNVNEKVINERLQVIESKLNK